MDSQETGYQSSFDFVRIIEPRVFVDDVGSSLEIASERVLMGIRSGLSLLEDRLETSNVGVVRGLHYQLHKPQARLMRVISGSALFVAVDLRRSSPEFSLATCLELSEEGRQALWVPEGFACGYMSLQEGSRILMKLSEPDDVRHSRTLLWNDPALRIEWPRVDNVLVSAKDMQGKPLAEAECFE